MTEIATVARISGRMAHVELPKKDACGACRACNFGGKDKLIFIVENAIGCKAGDKVILQLPEKKSLFASLIVYFLPVAVMLATLLITAGITDNAVYQIISAFAGLVLGFVPVIILDRVFRRKEAYRGKILKILTKEDITNDSNYQ